jgi:hypothetical protein
MSTPPFGPVSTRDIRTVSAQLGRPARDVVGIAARCICGAPTVVSTAPRLKDGTPFPTFYYLTHPAATAAISALEATQVMNEYNDQLAGDDELQQRYRAAHEAYLADRESIGVVDEIHGISAGGMPVRVKCLHALAGHSLAAGAGVNPIGDLALERSTWSPTVCQCDVYDLGDDVSDEPLDLPASATAPGSATVRPPTSAATTTSAIPAASASATDMATAALGDSTGRE